MKKLIMLLLLVSMSVFAGQWDEEEQSYYEGGIKVGLGGSTVIGSDSDIDGADKGFKVSYQIGAFFISPINDQLSFQSELLLDFKGATYSNSNSDSTATINESFLTVPLLLSFKANNNFKIYGGGYISLLLNSEMESDSYTMDLTDESNQFDYGLSVGAMFKNGKFVFDFRYNHGFATLDKDGDADVYNQQFMISAGYLF